MRYKPCGAQGCCFCDDKEKHEQMEQRIKELEAILPSSQALEVFAKAKENHKGDLPWDARLVPNQWLINERARSQMFADMVDTLRHELGWLGEDG